MTDNVLGLPSSTDPPDDSAISARVRSGTVKLAVGLGLGQIFTILLYLVTARNSSPRDFGLVMSALVGVTLAANLVNFGSNVLFIRELASGTLSDSEFVSRWSSKVLVALAAAGISVAVLSLILRSLPLATVLGLAASLFLYSVSQTSQAPLQAESRFGLLSVINLVDKGGALTVAVILHLLQVPAHQALPLGIAAGTGSATVLALSCWRPALRRQLSGVRSVRISDLRNPWKGSGHFGASSLLVSSTSADVLVLGALGGPAAAGLYSAVGRWVQPFVLASSAYTQGVFPSVASAPSDRDGWRRTIHGWRLLWVLLTLVCALIGLGPFLIDLLLGEDYKGSIHVLTVLAIGIPAMTVNQPLYSFLQARGRDVSAARAIAIAIATQFCLVVALAPAGGVAGAIASAASQWTLLCILGWRVRGVLAEEAATDPRADRQGGA